MVLWLRGLESLYVALRVVLSFVAVGPQLILLAGQPMLCLVTTPSLLLVQEPVSYGSKGTGKAPQGPRYLTLSKLASAETLMI